MHVTLGELAPDGGDVGEPALAGAAIEPELDGERRIAEQRQLLGHVGAGGVGAGGAETSCHTRIMQKGCDTARGAGVPARRHLPAQWVMLVVSGFTAINWGSGIRPLREAFVTSGSSMLTLGFVRPPGVGRVLIAFVEAGIGLVLVSLMISYLPTIYGSFSRREALVGMLEVRAGLPPSPAELLTRYVRIQWINRMDDDLFVPWEAWFVDVEESHTSHPALVYFRSPHPERSWVTAAGCVLDTAALACSVIDRPYDARGPVMLRSGFFCLRRIADFFGLAYDLDPAPDAPISVSRREFDLLCVELQAAGVPLWQIATRPGATSPAGG